MTTRCVKKRARFEEVRLEKSEASNVKRTAIAAVSSNYSSAATISTTINAEEEWEDPVEIKFEVDDPEFCLVGEDEDVKPDVFELQQEILGQPPQPQQQPLSQPQSLPQPVLHPQLLQLPLAQPYTTVPSTPAAVTSTSALLPPSDANRFFIISDLDGNGGLTLTPLSTNSPLLNNLNIADDSIGSNFVAGKTIPSTTNVSSATVTAAATIGGKDDAAAENASGRNCLQTLMVGNTIITTTNTPSCSGNVGAMTSKVPHYVSEADEVDMQESDSDEDGYSEINFDEDDELIEDEGDVDVYDPVWTDQPTAPRRVFPFERSITEIGLEGRPRSTNPVFYFDKLIGDREEFFAQLADGSNKYAMRVLNIDAKQTYMKSITSNEMRIFFGLCLQMSSLRLSSLREYWDDDTHYGFNGFHNKMSLNRFQTLLQVLSFESFSEKSSRPISGPSNNAKTVFKSMKPLVDYFNRRMDNIYKCGQRLVLNEPIMFWKRKLDWACNMSEKYRYNAVMLHFLTEQTGLILKIVPEIQRKKQNLRNSRSLVSERIALAMELMKEKLGKGHTIHISKYYGSYGLCHVLTNCLTYSTGFLECKRYGNSKQLILTKLLENLFAKKYAGSIMMGKCRRRHKFIYFFSSDCIAINAQEMANKNLDTRPKIIKELDWQLKPSGNIHEYMLAFQLELQRKYIKWDKRLMIYIFNLMVLNAYILYTMHAQIGRARVFELHLKDISKLVGYEEYRQDVIASLLDVNEPKESLASNTNKTNTSVVKSGKSINERESQNSSSVGSKNTKVDCDQTSMKADIKSLEDNHAPKLIPQRNGKTMKKRCKLCRKGGMFTFSKLYCEGCTGMPGLCESPCFAIWHKQLKKK